MTERAGRMDASEAVFGNSLMSTKYSEVLEIGAGSVHASAATGHRRSKP